MLGALSGDTKVYIVTGRTDMRRSFDGLMALIRDTYQMDPYADALYLFCGRKRNTLKALYFDQTGFVLCTKRLDNGKFQWPRDAKEARLLTRQLASGRTLHLPAECSAAFRQERFLTFCAL